MYSDNISITLTIANDALSYLYRDDMTKLINRAKRLVDLYHSSEEPIDSAALAEHIHQATQSWKY